MTFLDPDTEDGVLFITLTGFMMDLHERPSFVLRKSTHGQWFDFYYASFWKLRDSDRSVEVDFGKTWGENVRGKESCCGFFGVGPTGWWRYPQ